MTTIVRLCAWIAGAGVAAARPVTRRDVTSVPGFDYATQKLHGVNLGGWFVLEPYMTPSLFSSGFAADNVPVDEYHWTQQLGKDQAQSVLEQHWDSWIQEADFAQIAAWGLDFVRIPIGYWAFLARPEDPYVQGQVPYLDRALGWAKANNIKVWIDLHGVPGSQNGFDNSGLRDTIQWQNPAYQNVQQSLDVLDTISERYAGPDLYDTVIGIELVNEPLGASLNLDELRQFYEQGYEKVRSRGEQGVIVHDAYEYDGLLNGWLQTPDYYNVVEDHHYYQVFSVPELQRSIDDHVQYACNTGRQNLATDNKWHLVGEWSAALTDCAPLLNGVYRGARYSGQYENDTPIGSCDWIQDISQWGDERKQDTRRYLEAQLDAWEYGGAGWVIWSYKTENLIDWDLRKLIEYGLFPQPITDRQYPNQCGF